MNAVNDPEPESFGETQLRSKQGTRPLESAHNRRHV